MSWGAEVYSVFKPRVEQLENQTKELEEENKKLVKRIENLEKIVLGIFKLDKETNTVKINGDIVCRLISEH